MSEEDTIVKESQNQKYPTIAKEISWLSFNERVLQEASDEDNPLIERLRFLGIFSNNLDEFFRVRVADVRRIAAFAKGDEKTEANDMLGEILNKVFELQREFERSFRVLQDELAQRKIFMINEKEINDDQAAFIQTYFTKQVLPELAPILFDDQTPIPEFVDGGIYFAIKIHQGDGVRYAVLRVPTHQLPRFVVVPSQLGKRHKYVVILDNIIRFGIDALFRGILEYEQIEAYVFKVTRDAELELGEGITQTLLDKVSTSLRKRKAADPVRFVYDQSMPEDLLNFLVRRLKLGNYDSMIPGGRYHNSKDFIGFPNVGGKHLEFKPLPALACPEFDAHSNPFDAIKAGDILLYYPYHDFRYLIDLLRTAAVDPAVKEIKICVYRTASNSRVVSALINAARNNTQVTVVVELQARFDELSNIEVSRELTDAGVHVIFGVPGLKVHSKLILISRQEGGRLRRYAHIGTGNFNEKTARIYTDFSLFTRHTEICDEVAQVFDFINYTYRQYDYKHLLVSPVNSRDRLLGLIEQEINNAKEGKLSGITIKCNNLVDKPIVAKLYEASKAGVKIRAIIRGMCSLEPGVAGLSENIEIISIVDRFLEHPRVYLFENGGERQYYIGSADLMTRNIDHRVEVIAPILDPKLQQRLWDIIQISWNDNVSARIIDKDMSNRMRSRGNRRKVQSQLVIHNYLKEDIVQKSDS